jgi:hypothetical protein
MYFLVFGNWWNALHSTFLVFTSLITSCTFIFIHSFLLVRRGLSLPRLYLYYTTLPPRCQEKNCTNRKKFFGCFLCTLHKRAVPELSSNSTQKFSTFQRFFVQIDYQILGGEIYKDFQHFLLIFMQNDYQNLGSRLNKSFQHFLKFLYKLTTRIWVAECTKTFNISY